MGTLSRSIFQVFINFRGKDVRCGFASHLEDAFKRHNVNYFIDRHEQKGRRLNYLFKRIKESTIALVILSTSYAESKWCLDELSTIMEQEVRGEIVAIPIFYKVKPRDVRKQKGEFGLNFLRWTQKSSREDVDKWQMALTAVSNNVGFTLDPNRSEAKFIKKVIKKVGKVLADIQHGEGREEHSVAEATTYTGEGRGAASSENVATCTVVLTLPTAWLGSAVGKIGAVLIGFAILVNTVHRIAAPAMVALVGSVVARSSSWGDKPI